MPEKKPEVIHRFHVEYNAAGKTRDAAISIPGDEECARFLTIPAGKKSAKFKLGLPADLNGLCLLASRPVQVTVNKQKKPIDLGPALPLAWAHAMKTPCPFTEAADTITVTVIEPDEDTVSIDLFAVWFSQPIDVEDDEPTTDTKDDDKTPAKTDAKTPTAKP